MSQTLSSPPRGHGLLRVASAADAEAQQVATKAAQNAIPEPNSMQLQGLSAYITRQYWIFSRHRNTVQGWNDRMLKALRVFNGQYDPEKLAAIKLFEGSDVYARIISVKCRGASSLLRDVYLGSDRPWGISPTPTPSIPDNADAQIQQQVRTELTMAMAQGAKPQLKNVQDRLQELRMEALGKAETQAREAAKLAEERIDTILDEGGFYQALAEFLVDLPVFPFAVMKGPVVRMVEDIKWKNGKLTQARFPRMYWERVSPFDFYFTPGVSRIEDADVIQRQRLTRADLNNLIGLPGFDSDAIKAVLALHGRGGLVDWIDVTDAERAVSERRENPQMNESGMIDCLEWNGNVMGQMLLDRGFTSDQVPEPELDVYVQAWIIGHFTIKCQIVPNPRKRHPFYVTSFEKVPGSIVGNALPDILADVQEVCNSTLRSLVNNLSIASGPQVVVNDSRLANTEDGNSLYPWKRWHTQDDPTGSNTQQPAVSFFNPQDNSEKLLGVYQAFSTMADDLSGIPKYITGNSLSGGAGRTASGLSMLMQQANKILQTVAANIDRDIIEGLLNSLYDLIMMTDTTGMLRGDEDVRVMGVQVAVQRETQRQRQIEFLQATANPIDAPIMGPEGRANVLRSVASTIGLDGEQIVPSEAQIKAKMAAMANMPPTQPPGAPGQPPSPGAAAQGAQPPQNPNPQPQGTNTVSPNAGGTAQNGGV